MVLSICLNGGVTNKCSTRTCRARGRDAPSTGVERRAFLAIRDPSLPLSSSVRALSSHTYMRPAPPPAPGLLAIALPIAVIGTNFSSEWEAAKQREEAGGAGTDQVGEGGSALKEGGGQLS